MYFKYSVVKRKYDTCSNQNGAKDSEEYSLPNDITSEDHINGNNHDDDDTSSYLAGGQRKSKK